MRKARGIVDEEETGFYAIVWTPPGIKWRGHLNDLLDNNNATCLVTRSYAYSKTARKAAETLIGDKWDIKWEGD